MNKKTNIEIEFRSMFDKKKYDKLTKFFNANAEDLGEDNKDVCFFIFSNKLLKVVNNVSKKTAELVMKLTKIGYGNSFEEIEIPINSEDINNTIRIFTFLGCKNIMQSFQQRHNYLYKGVNLALKYSEHWGHHLELEIMIDKLEKKRLAEKQIMQIAKELKVHLMTDEELKKFTKKVESEYKRRQK